MAANQASMARRQRERERQQKRRQKQAKRQERREERKSRPVGGGNEDPLNDPTIDWGAAVREGHVEPAPAPRGGEAPPEG